MNTETKLNIVNLANKWQDFWIEMLKDEAPELTIGGIYIFKIGCAGRTYYSLFTRQHNGHFHYITETIDSAYGELENNSTNLQDAVDLALAHEFDYSI